MYCGALGKTGNCQVGVSVHAVTDWASAAIDWRLFLPESWDDAKAEDAGDEQAAVETRARRARSAIPEEIRHREKWRLALDMLDEIIGEWGVPRRPVVADAGYGDAAGFRLGLTERTPKAPAQAWRDVDGDPVDSRTELGAAVVTRRRWATSV
jgi:SRSO17 transposase